MKVRYTQEAFDALVQLRETTRFGSLMEWEVGQLETRLRQGDYRRGQKLPEGYWVATFETVIVTFERDPEEADAFSIFRVERGPLGREA